MSVLTVNINDQKDRKALKAIKAVLEGFDLDYDLKKSTEQELDKEQYDAQFVAKIEKSRSDYEAGKGAKITLDDIWK